MATKEDVGTFLQDFKVKMGIWDVLFRDQRGKNTQALADLELRPFERIKILEELKIKDFSEGPIKDTLYKMSPMWVFGKIIKTQEVYIKITMGIAGSSVICISFHLAKYPMSYPFKEQKTT